MLSSPSESALTPGSSYPQSSSGPPLVLLLRRFEFIDCKPQSSNFQKEVTAALASHPKTLGSKSFYDEEGSRLLEQICDIQDYYSTRSEMAILETYADEMKNMMGETPLLIEFGSGNSRKIQLLLDKLIPAGCLATEISREQLLYACDELSTLYPQLLITAVCADYCQPLHLPEVGGGRGARRLTFIPISTIGNFTPESAVQFLS